MFSSSVFSVITGVATALLSSGGDERRMAKDEGAGRITPVQQPSRRRGAIYRLDYDFESGGWKVYKMSGSLMDSAEFLGSSLPILQRGDQVWYRVVNINPFLYRVEGKNDLALPSTADLTEAVQALVKGSLPATPTPASTTASTAPAKADAEAAKAKAENSKTVDRVLATSPATIANPVSVTTSRNSDASEIFGKDAQEAKAALPKVRAKAEAERTDLLAEFERALRSRTPKELAELNIEALVVQVAGNARLVGEVEVAAIEYCDTVCFNEMVTLFKGDEIKADQPKMGPLPKVDELKKAITEVGKLGGLRKLFVGLLMREEGTASSLAVEVDPALSTASRRSIQFLRQQARVIAASTDPKLLESGQLGPILTQRIADVTAAKEALDDSVKSFKQIMETNRKRVTESRAGLFEMLIRERLIAQTNEPYAAGKNRDILAYLRYLAATDRVKLLTKAIASNDEYLAKLVTLEKDLEAVVKAGAEAEKAYKEALPGVQREVSAAEGIWNQIDRVTFVIDRLPATVAEEGRVTYRLKLKRVAEDGTETDLPADRQPKDFTYEVQDRSFRRIVFSTGYVGHRPDEGFSRVREVTDGNDDSSEPVKNVITRNVRGTYDVGSAVFAHVPFNPAESRQFAATFGSDTSFSKFLLGVSYIDARNSGIVVNFGRALGQRTVLETGFKLNDDVPDPNTQFTERVWGDLGWFFSVSFRLDDLLRRLTPPSKSSTAGGN